MSNIVVELIISDMFGIARTSCEINLEFLLSYECARTYQPIIPPQTVLAVMTTCKKHLPNALKKHCGTTDLYFPMGPGIRPNRSEAKKRTLAV